jgi:hypothetical protein
VVSVIPAVLILAGSEFYGLLSSSSFFFFFFSLSELSRGVAAQCNVDSSIAIAFPEERDGDWLGLISK